MHSLRSDVICVSQLKSHESREFLGCSRNCLKTVLRLLPRVQRVSRSYNLYPLIGSMYVGVIIGGEDVGPVGARDKLLIYGDIAFTGTLQEITAK